METFFGVFSFNEAEQDPDETIQDGQRLRWVEKQERFGLCIFKRDYLVQYLGYLRGLQQELEVGDFYEAKQLE